jgi:hypothetical protein
MPRPIVIDRPWSLPKRGPFKATPTDALQVAPMNLG